MILEGGWVVVGRRKGEEVVHGEPVDLTAVRAAVFDFGAAYRFVATVCEWTLF